MLSGGEGFDEKYSCFFIQARFVDIYLLQDVQQAVDTGLCIEETVYNHYLLILKYAVSGLEIAFFVPHMISRLFV